MLVEKLRYTAKCGKILYSVIVRNLQNLVVIYDFELF